jgi:outer membrane protein TolC
VAEIQMKKIFRSLLISLALLSAFRPMTAHAAEALTWEECVREASLKNPDLFAASANLRSTSYLAKGARSDFFPQLTANFGYGYGNTTSTISTTSGSSTNLVSVSGTSSTYSASVSATQNLFNGFEDKGGVQQAKANQAAAKANLDIVKAKVSFDLHTAFSALVYAQNSLHLSQDIVRRRKENLDMIQLRYENGSENKGSFLLSKAYLENARYEELQAEDNIRVAQVQMAKVLGRDNSNIFIAGDVPLSEPPVATTRLNGNITPEYAQAAAQKQAAKAGVTIARGPFFPNLDVVGTAGAQDNEWIPGGGRWSVQGQFSWLLFNGGANYYATKSAAASLAAANSTQESVRLQTTQKLEQALAAFIESIQKVKADQSFVEASTVREEIAKRRYENGLLSFEDWDIIQNDLIERLKQALLSQRDRVVSQAAWEQAQGKGVFQ